MNPTHVPNTEYFAHEAIADSSIAAGAGAQPECD